MAASDVIELRRLVASGFCGTLPEEQQRPQPLEIDLDIRADLRRAGATDDVVDTVDYGAICEIVERVVKTERFGLLERLAERLAEVVLADDRAISVTVAVRKLRPPVSQQLATAGVRITRERS
ncbi:MAG: dihydroneopterin aldolase [Acidimicrobiales bacterium]